MMQNISTNTITNLLKAVEEIGEKEVNEILQTLSNRDVMILNDVVNLCCVKLDINKSFLSIKNNRTKTDLLSIIIYILRKNNISPKKIKNYFTGYTIRVNEMYENILNLSDIIPYELALKKKVSEIEQESYKIFDKYHLNKQ